MGFRSNMNRRKESEIFFLTQRDIKGLGSYRLRCLYTNFSEMVPETPMLQNSTQLEIDAKISLPRYYWHQSHACEDVL